MGLVNGISERKRESKMVKFRSLYNDSKNRMVRDVIDSPTGTITIFEPSVENIEAIMQLDDIIASFNQDPDENGEGTLDIDGVTVLRSLIPMLTDLEIEDDMTEEEAEKILENPTLELMQVKEVLEGIVTQIYMFMILRYKNNMEASRMVRRSKDMSDTALVDYISESARSDEGRQKLTELNRQADKVIQMKQAQEDKETPQTENEPSSASEGKVIPGKKATVSDSSAKLAADFEERFKGI